MNDLISRQAAIDACTRVRKLQAYDEIEEIKALPSANAEPVKHGRWLDMQYPLVGHTFISCSECGERLDIDSSYKSIINYCPNCGSKMDGE